jgi:(1->4)-alpha-D-glucan 1-alpha-D-glucosylmutase
MNSMDDVLDNLLAETMRDVAARRRLPGATYRLQFHAGFTFRDACRLVPYLRDLGITHCYASPYLKARPGSQHGYDIIDHRVLNPEIGTEADYDAWVAALHEHGMGQILDTVPNHMGIVGNENPWWNDVLENGPSSQYAAYFDIAWYASPRPELQGKVLLPILGEPYGKVLEAGQIRLEYAAGAFQIAYFDHRFPVSPGTYARVPGNRLEELAAALGPDAPAVLECQSILTAVKHLPGRFETHPERLAERQREKEIIKRRLAALTEGEPAVREHIERTVAQFNGTPGEPRSFDLLDRLLDDQAYRLAYWRVAADEINYRRFFDVNELAALSMEREEVFAATHALVLRLLWEGKVTGLRIDHPDGLYDPQQYLQRLQQAYVLGCARRLFEARPEYQGRDWNEVEGPLRERIARALQQPADGPAPWPLYVVVEKILGADEQLPAGWPTYGTSGYDFLNLLNGLFVEADHAAAFTQVYQDWIDDDTPFAELVYRKKFLILQIALSSELHMLSYELDRLAQRDRWSRDFTLHGLRHMLREVISCFPVYRSYLADGDISEDDRKHVLQAVRRAKFRSPTMSTSLFTFLKDTLLQRQPRPGLADEDYPADQRHFAGKFQQVTSPVMAKGLEDTTFYVYNRLLSLNEVGGDPDLFGRDPAELHRAFQERRERWPFALSTTSTHDTKRSQDVRARLNVLSEMPDEWAERLERWGRLNEPHLLQVEDAWAPDRNEEYLIYQTLLGAWPLEPYTAEEYAAFVQRILAYLAKALHEAKVHTSWINPDPAYDSAVSQFATRILDPEAAGPFLDDLRAFQRRLSHYGLFNSLAQTLVKIAAPGVPDTYQGTELWDFSLVDPDNRRPVDYERRIRMLSELQGRVREAGGDLRGLAAELTAAKADGRITLYVTSRALQCRREHAALFTTGAYTPVEAAGARREHVFSFLREDAGGRALVAVPRLLTRLVAADQTPVGGAVWRDTVLPVPGPGTKWVHLLTGETLAAEERGGQGVLPAARVFGHFPVALLLCSER